MITIYGKANCSFCTQAKTLAETRSLKYEYKDVGISKDTLNELMDRAPVAVKTVPQIFIGNDYVGGFNDLVRYIEETGYTGTGESL